MKETTSPEDAGERQFTDGRTIPGDDRRRFVLADLLRHARPVAAYDLADRLSSWGARNDVDDLATAGFRRVRDRLVEEYLPPLVEAGLVEPVGGDRYALTDAGLAAALAVRGLDPDAVRERGAPRATDGGVTE
jgi:hypothetical protein